MNENYKTHHKNEGVFQNKSVSCFQDGLTTKGVSSEVLDDVIRCDKSLKFFYFSLTDCGSVGNKMKIIEDCILWKLKWFFPIVNKINGLKNIQVFWKQLVSAAAIRL